MGSKTPFRWEQSAGLDHSCGTCGTNQNHPKAKQTCFGLHTEPCSRYHQIMFFVGASHTCDFCIRSNKQHEKRHTAIAELVNEYKQFEELERLAVTPTRQGRKRVGSVNNALEPLDAVPGVGGDQVLREDRENDAETSTETLRSSTTRPPMSRAQKRAEKKKAKAEKSISKACKNQQRYVATIRAEDIERVAQAIHGDDYDVQRSLGNPLAIYKTNEDLERHMSDMPDFDVEEDIEDLVATIMANLGVHSAPSTVSPKAPLSSSFNTPGRGKRTKTVIVQKLAAAIAEDVVNHRNEQRQTQQRAAGFWRYANHEILVRLRERAQKRSNEAAKD